MAERKTSTAHPCSCKEKKGVNGKSKSLTTRGKRKRQTLVHNPDEEVWHEPYMNSLRKEFSQASIPCDSKIELPWKDIALPAIAKKIRGKIGIENNMLINTAGNNNDFESIENTNDMKSERKLSDGKMNLPWNDLLVEDTVVPLEILRSNGAPCDSTLEIPWDDLALDKPFEIKPIINEISCDYKDIEIPWDDILVPDNIVIKIQKKKKHPSSKIQLRNNYNKSNNPNLRNNTSNKMQKPPNTVVPCCVKTGRK